MTRDEARQRMACGQLAQWLRDWWLPLSAGATLVLWSVFYRWLTA